MVRTAYHYKFGELCVYQAPSMFKVKDVAGKLAVTVINMG